MRTRNVEAYAELHRRRTYGNTAVKMRRFIEPWVTIARPVSLIDYGAGQGGFADVLDAPTLAVRDSYDPAIPEIATIPRPHYDLALSIDVLEHLEPDEVDGVLADIARIASRALVVVTTVPARAILPDGRNAHTTLAPGPWWRDRIRAAFGEAESIPVFRKGRAGFKTWRSSPAEWATFLARYAPAELRHQLGR
jgi:hypothetical protein